LEASPSTPNVLIRRALPEDAPGIRSLIDASIRKLGGKFYTPEQVESSLSHVFGVDSTMISDGTYFVVEVEKEIIGAGGWSFRLTPFGGDQEHAVRDASVRAPGKDPAVIRAMYVHPDWARRKIGHLIITTCEHAARAAGFQSYELVATLSGLTFYKNQGYHQVEEIAHRLPDGVLIDFVRMAKTS